MSCYSIISSFSGVLGIFASITILENVHRPCKQFPNLVNTCLHDASSFFSWFCLIFSLYLCWLPYLEMCTDHVNSTPTLLTTVNIMFIPFLLSCPSSLCVTFYAPSFLGEISHDLTIVAPSFSFLNVVKSCDLLLFSCRKNAKKQQKSQWWENVLLHISTMGAL